MMSEQPVTHPESFGEGELPERGDIPVRPCDMCEGTGWITAEPVSDRERSEAHVAWLLWCISEGYIKAEDRSVAHNWFLDDPATLHPEEAAARPHWLAMAAEVLCVASGPVTARDV